jgi:plasmid stabilization system protein ParE
VKVVVTGPAEADLEAIGDYIAERNPGRSITFVQELRASCLVLGDMPRSYPVVGRYQRYELRRRVHGNYLIFYRLRHETVEIVRVLHAAMHYESIFFPEG